jgi:NADPH:quinone reductase-like Zn-dependent oxidoreductase
MSAFVLAPRYGDPEVIEVGDRQVPPPQPGRVVIGMRAAGVNPADGKQIAGAFGRDESRLPIRPGSEVAGVVLAVGEDATGPDGPIAVGDEVLAYRVIGGWAAEVIARSVNVFSKPERLSFPEAACLLLAGTTAAHLVEAADVHEGDVVLVHGASGGVGVLAVQLAALRGARVLGTAGAGNLELVREHGGEPVQYGPGLQDRVEALAPGGITVALDCAGTDEALAVSLALLPDPARLAAIVNLAAVAAAGGRALGNGPGADPGTAFRDGVRGELVRLAGEGRLRVPVAATFPLEGAADALRFLETAHAGGKIALVSAAG